MLALYDAYLAPGAARRRKYAMHVYGTNADPPFEAGADDIDVAAWKGDPGRAFFPRVNRKEQILA